MDQGITHSKILFCGEAWEKMVQSSAYSYQIHQGMPAIFGI